MRIDLVPVKGRSIYKPGTIPKRLAFLAAEAVEDWNRIKDIVVVSDMFRSPEASLKALQEGRGAAAPGLSAHNYGRAIDIDVEHAMDELGFRKKKDLDSWMFSRGWACWRNDGKLDRESWHYYHRDGEKVDYVRGSAVKWWNRMMVRWYPTTKPRAAEYMEWWAQRSKA